MEVVPGENHVRFRIGDDGAQCVMSLLGASSWDTFIPPLPAQPSVLFSRFGVFLGTAAVLHVQLSAVLEDGSLVKTMSDASDWRCWRLVRHIPVEGIVLGFLHAHTAGSLIPLQPAVGGRLHLFRLPVLYHRAITMFVGATTITTDALPLLVWRMLCRPCYSYSDGCFAIMVATCWSPSTDALPSWCCSGGCLATLMLFQSLSQRLGVGTLCVGSDALYRLVWLGGLCGGPSLFSVVFV